MQATLDHARALGCVEAWVLTDHENPAALALYRKVGGAQSGTDLVMFTFVFRPRDTALGTVSRSLLRVRGAGRGMALPLTARFSLRVGCNPPAALGRDRRRRLGSPYSSMAASNFLATFSTPSAHGRATRSARIGEYL